MKIPFCCGKFMELKTTLNSLKYRGCFRLFFQCKKCGKVSMVSRPYKST